MKTILKYTINAANPRLSDEEPDLLEQDEGDSDGAQHAPEGWVPWSQDDLIDIYRIIGERMTPKQRQVFEAFLAGQNNKTLGVTEKYWRYHFDKGIKLIKKEMKI